MAILIVDDSSDARKSIRMLLETRGYCDILAASTGPEALAILKSAEAKVLPAVDVVIMDVGMPGISGLEVCRQLKEDAALRDIPVLVLTGHTDDRTLEEAFAAGAMDFIPKAGSPNELLARVRSACRLKHELDNRKAREQELLQVTLQLKELNAELQRLAILDELTGVANRRFFNHLFSQEWARATREMIPLSLLMIDIDYFKKYNDHYGHQQGDNCLKVVATALSSLAKRPSDYVARYGGEEFVAILGHTDLSGALSVAEMLRKKVESLRLEHAGSVAQPWVTISVGVASAVPERGKRAELLLAAADQALYRAKAAGRNRVMYYHGPLAEAPPDSKSAVPPPKGLRNWKMASS